MGPLLVLGAALEAAGGVKASPGLSASNGASFHAQQELAHHREVAELEQDQRQQRPRGLEESTLRWASVRKCPLRRARQVRRVATRSLLPSGSSR